MPETPSQERPPLSERIATVQEAIRGACGKSGRDPDAVTLVAVSKTFAPEVVSEAAQEGLMVFGESRVQEAQAKIPACPGHLAWHFIGHLQRNKAKAAVELFDMMHAVDSERLLDTLGTVCEARGRVMPICLEVNVSGEGSKYGLAPEELMPVAEKAMSYGHLDVVGLMTLPPFAEDPEKARPHFARLRELRDACVDRGFRMDGLSMGMSHDFHVAIEEGATWVRVGSRIFGKRSMK